MSRKKKDHGTTAAVEAPVSTATIAIELLDRHAVVPSGDEMLRRYVDLYAGKPVGRAQAPAPVASLQDDPGQTMGFDALDLREQVAAAVAADAAAAGIEFETQAEPRFESEPEPEGEPTAMFDAPWDAPAEAPAEPAVDEGAQPAFDAGETPEGATAIVDLGDFDEAPQPVTPPADEYGTETMSFEAIPDPEVAPEFEPETLPDLDLVDPEAATELAVEARDDAPTPTIAMDAVTDDDADASGAEEESGVSELPEGEAGAASADGGRKKKKRRHR